MSLTLLIGTTKGAFLIDAETGIPSGPHCNLQTINHVVGDPASGHIWAGGGSPFSGASVWRTEDHGQSWTETRLSKGQVDEWAANDPDLAEMMGWEPVDTPFDGAVEAIWSLLPAHGRLYAGGKPGVLLVSDNGGETWTNVESLSDHPDKENWNPGAAGLVLHTLVPDPENPQKLWAGISAAGVFATEDGGATWERRNRLSNAVACEGHSHPAAPTGGDTGLCVHNIARAPGDVLYQQNHHGVWRSQDGGRHWDDITDGLPSTFGFPIGLHPHDPDTIWTIPLNGDAAGRFPPDAKAAVWKSTDGGTTWQAKRSGLPQKGCFFTVLRQAMAVDQSRAGGVYFGTNTGSVFASQDGGETWDEMARHLPTILSVEVLEMA